MKYPEDSTTKDKVHEAVATYSHRPNVHEASLSHKDQEKTIVEKIAYLREHLSPETFARLESNNFYINAPFPQHEVNEDWIAEAAQTEEEDAVPTHIVQQDMEAWKHVI